MRRRPFLAVIALGLAILPARPAGAEKLDVVATIAPIAGILEAVMQQSGNRPQLLLPVQTSPHLVQLRPSQAAMLEEADLVIRVGDGLETFLARLLGEPSMAGKLLTLDELPGILFQPGRPAGLFGHEEEEAEEEEEEGHDGADAHDHHGSDPHIWLDPRNGRIIAHAMAERLAGLDPVQADLYRDNATALGERLDEVEKEIETLLADVRPQSWLVLHDAFAGFEARFGIVPAGAFSVSPERRPGSRRLESLRHIVSTKQILCIFVEPQLDSHWLDAIFAENSVTRGILDPLGSNIPPGADHYPQLLLQIAGSLHDCLHS